MADVPNLNVISIICLVIGRISHRLNRNVKGLLQSSSTSFLIGSVSVGMSASSQYR